MLGGLRERARRGADPRRARLPGRRARPARAGRAGRDVRRRGAALRPALRASSRGGPVTAAGSASELQRELIVERGDRARRARAAGARRPANPASCARPRASSPSWTARCPARAAALHAAPCAQWAGEGPRRAYADELAAIYRRYRERLDDGRSRGRASCSPGARSTRCGASPQRWGATPLFVYGFDDFTRLELDALETRRRPLRRGRRRLAAVRAGPLAFKAVSGIVAELSQLAASSGRAGGGLRPLRARARARRCTGWSAACSRTSPPKTPSRRTGVVREHTAGGERAEVELVGRRGAGAAARRHAGRATSPSSCATRSRYASLVEQVFDAYGIPYSIDRSLPLGAHRRSAAACSRCCAARCSTAAPEDLLA